MPIFLSLSSNFFFLLSPPFSFFCLSMFSYRIVKKFVFIRIYRKKGLVLDGIFILNTIWDFLFSNDDPHPYKNTSILGYQILICSLYLFAPMKIYLPSLFTFLYKEIQSLMTYFNFRYKVGRPFDQLFVKIFAGVSKLSMDGSTSIYKLKALTIFMSHCPQGAHRAIPLEFCLV